MTPQEKEMLQGLTDRINQTKLPEKDPEAEQFLFQALGRNTDSLYILAQTVLVQQYALDQAKQQLDQAKSQLDQARQESDQLRQQSPAAARAETRQLPREPSRHERHASPATASAAVRQSNPVPARSELPAAPAPSTANPNTANPNTANLNTHSPSTHSLPMEAPHSPEASCARP